MEKRKQNNQLSYEQLQPFTVYRTPLASLLYFKKIDGKMFVSADKKKYIRSSLYFFPKDKLFNQYIPGDK